MPSTPEIPFGYKVVTGQLEKGDGWWDEDAKEWRRVTKGYPFIGTWSVIAIRRCTIEQPELPNVDAPPNIG